MMESFFNDRIVFYPGDSCDVLKSLADNSVDSCVTDPPYHLTSIVKRFGGKDAAPVQLNGVDIDASNNLKAAHARQAAGFMGKQWDGGDIAFRMEFWTEALRVLKPGGHVAAFGSTRGYHRMACAIEDAGFEIRDSLMWIYGTGFPKSHNVSKGIDKAAGAEREKIGIRTYADGHVQNSSSDKLAPPIGTIIRTQDDRLETAPATPQAAEWEGWGTALKPAFEPIVLARKPLSEKTVAQNVLRWRTGALNIDGCRVPTTDKLGGGGEKAETAGQFTNEGWRRPWMDDPVASETFAAKVRANVAKSEKLGRWPANVVHDGSDEVVGSFPANAGGWDKRVGIKPGKRPGGFGNVGHEHGDSVPNGALYGDSGSAARFFYSAKADSDDRLGSKHPTVKPVDLIQWLVRLITPPGGAVLDPFAGTGSTAEAALYEGMRCILIEREQEYLTDIRRRMALVMAGPEERKRESIKARGDVPFEQGTLFFEG